DDAAPAQRRGLDAAGINAVRSGGLTPPPSPTAMVKKKKNVTMVYVFVFTNGYLASPNFNLYSFFKPTLNPAPPANYRF
ncbi:hypothetical protein, partial [Enterobacter hormaechei]